MTSFDNLTRFIGNACLPAKVYLGLFVFNAIAGLFVVNKKKYPVSTLIVALAILVLHLQFHMSTGPCCKKSYTLLCSLF